ncbi:hypothetical protein [Poritiphilus flavus]|uniref:Fibronectin type-III domain-containing protein n=1 Tax=Poritiphilus flavus TaxID=2697053 RepID=A0A6L9E789_9FLAO|nr:hypothetical protein [Poritiphilus flavus]NAS10645.1 hypothetical protein [Poritiphilus flavus]
MSRSLVFLLVLAIMACKKDDPKPPEAAILEFPLQNSECTTGVDQNETTSLVEFRWQASNHTETYELRATNLNTSATQSVSTQTPSAELTLQKGTPYSWQVLSRNSNTQVTASSETWQFYNAGTQTTYAPFPATIVRPTSGASVAADSNNEVTLEWTGADVDGDISTYDIYLDTVNPPVNLVASPGATASQQSAVVVSGTVYYWKIVTTDEEGNSSDSGVYSFRVL